MIKLIAKKSFLRSGNMIERGKDFTVKTEQQAEEFISRDLAERLEEKTTEETATEAIDYEQYTVNELREIAKAKEVQGSISRMTKQELIEAIKERQ